MSDHSSRRVYVVDDEQVIAFTLAAILKNVRFDATPFTNPLHALQAASNARPDLLISDVMMPEMTGIELGIRFREEFPDCRIVLFSGQSATADLLEEARIQGHNFIILEKPIHPKDLLAAINRLTIN